MDRVVFDLEFTGDPRKPESGHLIAVGYKFNDDPVVVQDHLSEWLLAVLADPKVISIGHSKTDWRYVEQAGFPVRGPLHDTMVMAWVLNENTPLSLEYVANRYCGIEMDKRIKSVAGEPYFRLDSGEYVHLNDAPYAQVAKYNAEDVEATAALYDTLKAEMQGTAGWWDYFLREQVPFTNTLLRMELSGIPLNEDKAQELKLKLVPRLSEQAQKLDHILGYPLRKKDGDPGYGSGNLLRSVLFEKVWYEHASVPHALDLRKATLVGELALRYKKKKSEVTQDEVDTYKQALVKQYTPKGFTVQKITPQNLVGYYTRRGYGLPATPPSDPQAKDPKPSTAMPVLLSTFPGHGFITELQQWSKLRKVITTYLDAYPKFTHEGRLYGHFNQTGTKTGRLSSARPNLQNQPAHGELGEKVRGLFEGRLVIGDYSQLEPRLMAHFSQDERLLEVYAEDLDIYAVTAAGIFGGHHRDYDDHHPKRKMSKPLFLGDQYGAGFKKLTMLLRLNGFDVTPDEVKRFQAKMHAYFGTLTAYKEDLVKEARSTGHVVTLDGHRRRLNVALKDRNWKNRGYGERQAVNAKVQGSAGDVVRRAMVRAGDEFPMLDMLAQVHDEVLWEPHPEYTQPYIASILPDLQYVMEVGHEFDLTVPLKFEPVLANSWAEKGASGIEWLEEDDVED
jgi:DNA polymerase I-like protein with 3'-5' exonuclease and polymerase domains